MQGSGRKQDPPSAEMVSLLKRDVSTLADADLNRLIEEAKQEANRRKKVSSPNAPQASVRSRWPAAIALLVLACFILFKAETSEIEKDVSEIEDKPGAVAGTKDYIGESDERLEEKKSAKKLALEAANKQVEENARKKAEEDEAMKKLEVEEKESSEGEETTNNDSDADDAEQSDKKLALEQANKLIELENARKKAEEEEAAKKKAEEEEAAKKKAEEEEAAQKKAEEEEKEKSAAEETPATDPPKEEEKDDVTEAPEVKKEAENPVTAGVPAAVLNLPTKADDATKAAALKDGKRPMIKYEYKPRSALKDDAKRKELADKWGKWTLTDPKASERPKDFAAAFPNRDIPWDKFPANAWQTDQEYLAKFLPEARAHIDRAIEAMLAEYGWSKFDLPDQDLETRIDGGSFKATFLNMTTDNPQRGRSYIGDTLGGWVTQRYFDGLVRRLMHALITEDTFTLVMGGHSAAAGHGNHFQQSYTLQFFRVMEPIFARLGIKLMSHNIAYGGLGTVQTSLAAGDLLGREIDILVWDSSMTEPSNEAYDLFVRQTFLAGNRIPVLMGGMVGALRQMDITFDAEVGMFGTGVAGVPEVENADMADSIIWAARYLRCNAEMRGYCREREYNGTCWIDRDDYTPATPQNAEPGGRASWHPGFKFHAIKGRIIGFMVLRAFQEGLKLWDEAPDKKLPEDVWHVTNHYDNIRTKLKNVKEEDAFCFNYKELEPKILCTTPFNGVSEMTPRVNPRENAIRNVMKPAPDGRIPQPTKSVYDPPDVFNPILAVPEGEFDYLAVVENGIDFQPFVTLDNSPLPTLYEKTNNKLLPIGLADVKPGLGWGVDANTNPDECDGTYDGFCGRGAGNPCLLYGHNDGRGGVQFESFSGWGIFTIPNVYLGVILLRLEWWHRGGMAEVYGWTSENNENGAAGRRLSNTTAALSTRRLGDKPPQGTGQWELKPSDWTSANNENGGAANTTAAQRTRRLGEPPQSTDQWERRLGGEAFCDAGIMEVAVNGKITQYKKKDLEEKIKLFQRVVHIITVMDDVSVTKGQPHDIEFAVRMTGCEHKNLFKISHIYWA